MSLQVAEEMQVKACRCALWLALLEAQRLEWVDLCDALMELLRDVDQRRADLERSATE